MLEREDIRSTVKRAYEELGFEIENHTYGHNRLYMEDEAGLANAVCKQQMLVNDTLGVKLSDAFSAHAGRQWGKGSSLSSISGSARLLGNRELVLQRQQCRHLCH